ncbi:TVP38/TMEM64 family protein [Cohnella endophytica]|uniref:TVP38/TMEM64 family membrane protein n=1 Tax=Cohnella endophytica TaxID=2419778 RepID=A0A494XHJ4_9BACL|nr:TVP38/TMEM64 family protein [Cohnella endophytica]RKP50110.1 TVP38/TMEM64 family protein [Cohnella endophytica]
MLNAHLLGIAAWSFKEWLAYVKTLNLEQIKELLQRYSELGPLPGIILPFLESLFPFLPLVVFVVANTLAYGMWLGFLYSWIGASAGSMVVFLIARQLASRRGQQLRKKYPKIEKLFGYIERKGFTPIFLLSCFPFTPSILINVTAGLSKIPTHTYFTAMILGKAVMIFALAFLGNDLQAMIDHPWRIVLALFLLFLLWMGGRKLEARYS